MCEYSILCNWLSGKYTKIWFSQTHLGLRKTIFRQYPQKVAQEQDLFPEHLFTNSFLQFKNTLLPIMSYKPYWLTKTRVAEGLPSPLLIWWTDLWHLRERQSLLLFSSQNSSKCTWKDWATAFGSLGTQCLSAPLAKLSRDQKVRGQCHCALLSLIERNWETAVQKAISGKIWLIFFLMNYSA